MSKLTVEKDTLVSIKDVVGKMHSYMVLIDHSECARNGLPATSSKLGTDVWNVLQQLNEMLK